MKRRSIRRAAAFTATAALCPVMLFTSVPQVSASPDAAAAASYEPAWASVDRHLASPEWFQDAKFGIYWHWGAFTTPEYGFEWYGRGDVCRRQRHQQPP